MRAPKFILPALAGFLLFASPAQATFIQEVKSIGGTITTLTLAAEVGYCVTESCETPRGFRDPLSAVAGDDEGDLELETVYGGWDTEEASVSGFFLLDMFLVDQNSPDDLFFIHIEDEGGFIAYVDGAPENTVALLEVFIELSDFFADNDLDGEELLEVLMFGDDLLDGLVPAIEEMTGPSFELPLPFGGTFHIHLDVFEVTASLVPVPEPGTLALFGFGLAGLGFARRRIRAD